MTFKDESLSAGDITIKMLIVILNLIIKILCSKCQSKESQMEALT